MKKLAFTLAAIGGLTFASFAGNGGTDRPIKKAMKKEQINGKIIDPHKQKAHTGSQKARHLAPDRILKIK